MSAAKKRPHVDRRLMDQQHRDHLEQKLQLIGARRLNATPEERDEAARIIDTLGLLARALAPPGRKKGAKGKVRKALEALRSKRPDAKPQQLLKLYRKEHGPKPTDGRVLTIISSIDNKK